MGVTLYLVGTLCCLAVVFAQQLQPSTTPVPILKQINRQNEDGSYSYGYENADGSFKIETKFPTGEVYGKYGYVDAEGKVRSVEYGATKRGFEPSGTGIDVPPPTLVNENALQNADYDDGQYREDPSIYWKTDKFNSVPAKSTVQSSAPVKSASPTPAPVAASPIRQWSAPQQQTRTWSAPQQFQSWDLPQQVPSWNSPVPQQNIWNGQPSWAQPQQRSFAAPQQQWSSPQQQWSAPQQQWAAPQQSWTAAPIAADPNLFLGHPAKNFDINTGSYTITYNG